MESLQNIKRRLEGVKNIKQITKAMELVAATKMRKSQEIALASRPYAFASLELLANLTRIETSDNSGYVPPLLEVRPVEKTLFVVLTSDKGLAGAFNSGVIRSFEKYLSQENIFLPSPDIALIGIGQKAINHLKKYQSTLTAEFIRIGDYTAVEEALPIANLLIKGYLNHSWDRVIVFSTHFRNALRQEAIKQEIFPIRLETIRSLVKELLPTTGKYSHTQSLSEDTSADSLDYIIEPSPEALLNDLARHLVLMQIYDLILEANASEHAARRMAMKNASDNAGDLSERLTLEYNKSRQADITKQIIEISAGADSLTQ